MEADDSSPQIPGGPQSDGFHLTPGSGGGGDLTYDWGFWLWPLPPAGLVTVHVLWEGRGIPETATVVDLGPMVACAAEATELWPLPEQPPDTGWAVVAPGAGAHTFSTLRVQTDGDQPEPGGKPDS